MVNISTSTNTDYEWKEFENRYSKMVVNIEREIDELI